MGRKKTGTTVICPGCNEPYHRPRHNILHGTKKTCTLKCSGIMRRGAGNPFFGKHHPPEVLEAIAAKNRANPPKGTGPKKGIFKHTDEAKKKMSDALRERWRTKRADMLSYASSGLNTPYQEIYPAPRWKVCFTRAEKRDWVGTKCAYCFATDDLVLDHIIPVICGGINEKTNSQTLCQSCNRWKMKYVDRPLYFAILGSKRG